jgi:hypothetical protein
MLSNVIHALYVSEHSLNRWWPITVGDDRGKLELAPTGLHFVGRKIEFSISNIKAVGTTYVQLHWGLAAIGPLLLAVLGIASTYIQAENRARVRQEPGFFEGYMLGGIGVWVVLALLSFWFITNAFIARWVEISFVDEDGILNRDYFMVTDQLNQPHGFMHDKFIERLHATLGILRGD